jgi:integrase
VTNHSQPAGRRDRNKVKDHPGIYSFECTKHAATHYEYQYRVGGKQHWATVHDYLRVAVRERDKARSGGAPVVDGSLKTLDDLMQWHLDRTARTVRPNTARSYYLDWRRIKDRVGGLRLANLDPGRIEDVLHDLADPAIPPRKYKRKTLENTLGLIRGAGIAAVAARKLPHNPIPEGAVRLPIERAGGPKGFLSAAQLMRAHDLLEGDDEGQLLLELGGFVGLRRSEISGLLSSRVNPSDLTLSKLMRGRPRPVDLDVVFVDQVRILIPRGEQDWDTKSDAGTRLVPMPTVVGAAIRAAITARDPDEFLVSVKPGILRTEYLSRAWEKRAKVLVRAGLPFTTLHELRHSYKTMHVDIDIHEVISTRLMGHAVQGLSRRYAHLTWEQLRGARDKIDAHLRDLKA